MRAVCSPRPALSAAWTSQSIGLSVYWCARSVLSLVLSPRWSFLHWHLPVFCPLRPADFEGLIPLINAFRVKIKYKEPVYWRGDRGYFPLTTAGVLRREQARRKSRGWSNCGVFGPDGPDY